ncbi:MAG: ATP-binding cassette domain-containing protein [Deferribacteraceae bacterium]|jgi:cell division transport system ATP-binding protein|nr:ATP-binding cassette domain-containing protein [Deferribacteraceae bacterium]
MIRFERVGVVFKGDCHALSNISLHIARGEFVYILGRSGAGKSTLLKLIYADVLPTSGIASVLGYDISFLQAGRIAYLRRQVGVVFQDYMLIDGRTVFNNVRMSLDIYCFKKSEMQERIYGLLRRLGIFHLRDDLVEGLSGGEKQRVAVARALVNDPRIILADEPTGNLDRDNADIIMGMLLQAQKNGATILMATHDLGKVEKYPARSITLGGGRLLND